MTTLAILAEAFIDANGAVLINEWQNDSIDRLLLAAGNCYQIGKAAPVAARMEADVRLMMGVE